MFRGTKKTWNRRHWIAFSSVGLFFGLFVIWNVPIVPFQPICRELRAFSSHDTVGWRISEDFHRAFGEEVAWVNITDIGVTYLVTVKDWVADELLRNFTSKAVWNILEKRNLAKKFELTEDLIKSGLFDTFPRRVTCEGLREIAIVGGKWEFEGPNPD
ncbi:MAG: hypothetical protein ACE10M_12495 [Alphaproteobacteria bacterium]